MLLIILITVLFLGIVITATHKKFKSQEETKPVQAVNIYNPEPVVELEIEKSANAIAENIVKAKKPTTKKANKSKSNKTTATKNSKTKTKK